MHPASQAPAEQPGILPRLDAGLSASQDEARRMEQDVRRQIMSNIARWEGGHRAIIQGAEVSFPGGAEWRQEFARLEDRAIVNRTNQFLRHEDEEGASGDRFVTIVPLERLPAHEHRDCQVVMIGCSSAALNELKRDPLLHNEPESLPGSNLSQVTFSNTNEVKGRVQGQE